MVSRNESVYYDAYMGIEQEEEYEGRPDQLTPFLEQQKKNQETKEQMKIIPEESSRAGSASQLNLSESLETRNQEQRETGGIDNMLESQT